MMAILIRRNLCHGPPAFPKLPTLVIEYSSLLLKYKIKDTEVTYFPNAFVYFKRMQGE